MDATFLNDLLIELLVIDQTYFVCFDLYEILDASPTLFRRVTNLVRIGGTKDGERTIVNGKNEKPRISVRGSGRKRKKAVRHKANLLSFVSRTSSLTLKVRILSAN